MNVILSKTIWWVMNEYVNKWFTREINKLINRPVNWKGKNRKWQAGKKIIALLINKKYISHVHLVYKKTQLMFRYTHVFYFSLQARKIPGERKKSNS